MPAFVCKSTNVRLWFGAAATAWLAMSLLVQLNREMRDYGRLIGIVLAGPVVCSVNAFAVWSLTASLGVTHSFPWSEGPLGNWIVWLALASVSTFGTSKLRKREETLRIETQ